MENQSLSVEVVIAAYQREIAALHARAIVAEVGLQQALSEVAELRAMLAKREADLDDDHS